MRWLRGIVRGRIKDNKLIVRPALVRVFLCFKCYKMLIGGHFVQNRVLKGFTTELFNLIAELDKKCIKI